MTAFVDTSALLALLDADDAEHARVRHAWEELLERRTTLWCSNYVLVETSALVQSRLGLDALRVFTDDIVPVLRVHWVGRAEHDAGVAAVLTAGRKRLSLVDCVSFAVMRELGLRQALTLDGHFAEQGFGVRPPLH